MDDPGGARNHEVLQRFGVGPGSSGCPCVNCRGPVPGAAPGVGGRSLPTAAPVPGQVVDTLDMPFKGSARASEALPPLPRVHTLAWVEMVSQRVTDLQASLALLAAQVAWLRDNL